MRLGRDDVLLYRSDASRQAVSLDGAVGLSICKPGRVTAGGLWRLSSMVPKRAHRGVPIIDEPH